MVADLESQFDAANKDKNDAIKEQERCDLKLSLANRLITALASEGERWASTVEQLKLDYEVRRPALLAMQLRSVTKLHLLDIGAGR